MAHHQHLLKEDASADDDAGDTFVCKLAHGKEKRSVVAEVKFYRVGLDGSAGGHSKV